MPALFAVIAVFCDSGAW